MKNKTTAKILSSVLSALIVLSLTISVTFLVACDKEPFVPKTETLADGAITVHQGEGVSDDDFYAMYETLKALLTDVLISSQKANFKANFPTVYVVTGSSISHKPGELTVGCKATPQNIFKYLAVDNNLVHKLNNAKNTVRIAMGKVQAVKGAFL